jgi:RNA polymerase sigma-70 factor (ECF subfamily)
VYAYLRRRYGLGDDEGRDGTQEFFLWTLESDLFEKADPARGSFRGLLKTALRNFVFGEHRRAGRRKRGGGVAHVSLEFSEPPVLDEGLGPDESLDAQWRRDVMHRALGAVGGDAAELARAFYFEGRSYEQIAQARGMSVKDVENRLAAARKRLAAAVADVVAETVEGPDALREELRALFQ